MSDSATHPGIRKQVKQKQDEISNYLSSMELFGTRLTYVNILGGAIATLLNGVAFRSISQNSSSDASSLISVGAAICSLAATVAATLYKVRVESRLSVLKKCSAKLEGLAVLLDAKQLSEANATKRFQALVEECPPILNRRQLSFEAVKGSIAEPREGQDVAANFTASGTVENVGRGIAIWLTIEIDDRIWPKEGAVFVDAHGRWSHPVFEDGNADRLGISLWAANSEADRKLRAWLDGGNKTRTFPELRPLPGMKRLARVPGIRTTARSTAAS